MIRCHFCHQPINLGEEWSRCVNKYAHTVCLAERIAEQNALVEANAR